MTDEQQRQLAQWKQRAEDRIAELDNALATMTRRAEQAEAALLDAQRMAVLTPDDLYITPNAMPLGALEDTTRRAEKHMTAWPVLTLGNDREHVHADGAAAAETFIRNNPGAELLAVHTYTFGPDEYTNAEYIYLGIVEIQTAMPTEGVQP